MANKTKIIKVPGINGLGVTFGEELAPNLIYSSKCEEIELERDNVEMQENQIYAYAKNILKIENGKIIFIGGDHSISYPLSKAFFEKNPDSKLIVFDAHFDLMEPMKNPTHEEWLRALIETGLIKSENILLVGIRRISKNTDSREINYAKEKNINIIYSDEFDERKKEILNFSDEHTYVSFDVDVFDDLVVSATGYPEKNGLKKDSLFNLLKLLKYLIFDIVEVNPTKSRAQQTIKVAKEIIKILK